MLRVRCAAEDGQKLYVRLFLRKHRWIPKSKIVYNDIACDLSPVLDHVTNSGLIIDGMCYSLYPVLRHSATVLVAFAFQCPPSGTHSHKTYEAVTFPGNSLSVDLRHGCLSVLMCRWHV